VGRPRTPIGTFSSSSRRRGSADQSGAAVKRIGAVIVGSVSSDVFNDALPVNVSNRVAKVVEDYLAQLDATTPGLVDGVYLTGSVALGDYHAAWSEIDFVPVIPDRPTKQQQSVLADIHERVPPNTW